jgi:hypothetical protein
MNRRFDLVFALGHLDAARTAIHGLAHRIHGISDDERAIFESKVQVAQSALADAVHTLILILPEEVKAIEARPYPVAAPRRRGRRDLGYTARKA